MKNALLLSFILLISLSVTAQSTLEVRGYFGFSGALANRKVDLEGGGSVEIQNFKELGILVSKGLGRDFRINTGVNYSYSTVKNSFLMCNNSQCITVTDENDFQMLSIPIYAQYALGKYFYAAAGPILDFQLSEGHNFSDQSGFGYLIGLGGKIDKEKFSFSIFPHYKRHSVIPFDNSPKYKHVLQEFGLQFGVGYKL